MISEDRTEDTMDKREGTFYAKTYLGNKNRRNREQKYRHLDLGHDIRTGKPGKDTTWEVGRTSEYVRFLLHDSFSLASKIMMMKMREMRECNIVQ